MPVPRLAVDVGNYNTRGRRQRGDLRLPVDFAE
jgi:hypothetical protein